MTTVFCIGEAAKPAAICVGKGVAAAKAGAKGGTFNTQFFIFFQEPDGFFDAFVVQGVDKGHVFCLKDFPQECGCHMQQGRDVVEGHHGTLPRLFLGEEPSEVVICGVDPFRRIWGVSSGHICESCASNHAISWE